MTFDNPPLDFYYFLNAILTTEVISDPEILAWPLPPPQKQGLTSNERIQGRAG